MRSIPVCAIALVAFTACVEPNGPDPDPDPDPEGVVTVRALDISGNGIADLKVYGHDAAGTKVDETVTAADGRAFVEVPVGGSITAHDPDAARPAEFANPRWHTVFEVAPGDDILVRVWWRNVELETVRTVDVDAPTLPSGATRYRGSAQCFNSAADDGDGVVLTIDTRCPDRGGLVLTATDDAGAVVGYIAVADADLTQPVITVTGPWVTPSQSYSIDVTGLASGGGNLRVMRGALAGGYPVHWSSVDLTTTSTTASATAPRLGVGDGVVHRLSTDNGELCDRRSALYTRSRTSDLAGFAVDAADLLPAITDVAFADHALSWTGGGGGNGISASFSAATGSGDVVGPARYWSVVAPPEMHPINFPADTGFVWPAGAGTGDRITAVRVSSIASTYWTSYADVRQHHADDPPNIVGEFVTRTTSIAQEYAYLGCPTE